MLDNYSIVTLLLEQLSQFIITKLEMLKLHCYCLEGLNSFEVEFKNCWALCFSLAGEVLALESHHKLRSFPQEKVPKPEFLSRVFY